MTRFRDYVIGNDHFVTRQMLFFGLNVKKCWGVVNTLKVHYVHVGKCDETHASIQVIYANKKKHIFFKKLPVQLSLWLGNVKILDTITPIWLLLLLFFLSNYGEQLVSVGKFCHVCLNESYTFIKINWQTETLTKKTHKAQNLKRRGVGGGRYSCSL